MSQLIQLRQRIRAIQTTKKITHAMRLIAMSTHSSMRAQEPNIKFYHEHYAELFKNVYNGYPGWKNNLIAPSANSTRTLCVVVASQKGLCGAFNNQLFSFLNKEISPLANKDNDYIAVGKKAIDYFAQQDITPLSIFNNFMPRTLGDITEKLSSFLLAHAQEYARVTIYSNTSINFFANQPTRTVLLPLETEEQSAPALDLNDYVWEESIETVLTTLCEHYVRASLESLLFQSLFAEQAARFQSMDSATRNAEELLEFTERQYNKLRQAKITKELTELTSSFQAA